MKQAGQGEETVSLHNFSLVSVSRHKSEDSFAGNALTCFVCNTNLPHRPPSYRKRVNRAFCSQKCYHSLRQDGRYVQWRQGQRRARKAVAAHFELRSGNVVHHHDDDNRNNQLTNLAVFLNQAEHMAYHHGNPNAVPIWDGRAV